MEIPGQVEVTNESYNDPAEHQYVVSLDDVTGDLLAHLSASRITGPHIGQDTYGNVDHRYWRCEQCGTETTDKRALDACC